MVYFGCILIVFLSGCVGRIIANKFVVRDKFFKELIELCLFIKNNISFKNAKVCDLLQEYSQSVKSDNLDKFKLLLNISGCDLEENIIKEFVFLKKEEKFMIVNFFKNFGNADECAEIDKLENFISNLKSLSNSATINRQRNEGFIYKLSLLIGAVVCILII